MPAVTPDERVETDVRPGYPGFIDLAERAGLALRGLPAVEARGNRWALGAWAAMNCTTIGRQATSRGVADRVGEGGRVTIDVGNCEWCQSHAGEAVIGQDPLPPFHPSCSCTASAA